MNVEQEVIRVTREQLCVDNVTTESSIADDLGADSLDLLELGLAIEETFDLDIPDEDLEKFNTVQDIINYVSEKKK